MSRPVFTAVRVSHRRRCKPNDLARQQTWLFAHKPGEFDMERVREFFDANREAFGGLMYVQGIVARFKTLRKLDEWAKRKGRNATGLSPLTGWYGPMSFAN